MNAADRRRLTPTLGIVAAVLLVLLIVLWIGLGRGTHWNDDATPPRLPPVGANLPPPAVPPLEHFAEVWERPLFSPTRTPEPAAGSDNSASSDLVLTGVILLPHLKMAILHDKAQNKDYRVIEGRPSRGAPALVELHPRSAVVEASGSRLQLQLIPGPSPEPGTSPQPSQPPSTQSGDSEQPAASGMVTRQGDNTMQPTSASGSDGQAEAEARARQVKARVQADRRRAARQHDDGG